MTDANDMRSQEGFGVLRPARGKPTMTNQSPAALSFEGVSHRYDAVAALQDVSFRLEPGEVLCLVGPSGCGKSTALRLAAGLERLQSGQVTIAGRIVADRVTQVPPEDRGVGLVFQDYALFPHMTVAQNVAFGLTREVGRDQRARDALAMVGMADHLDVYPHMLSGGQQQRVALARALAPRPAVLLLDEPFSGLDRRLRDAVRDETLHLLKRSGASTLLVTHDPEEAMFMADRLAIMRAGALLQIGPPVELYRHPNSPFVAGFLGEINEFVSRIEAGAVRSPFGPLQPDERLNGAPDGTKVLVLIRTEAVLTAPKPESPEARRHPDSTATVMAARVLGRSSLVHLSVPDGHGGSLHMHARLPGISPPQEAQQIPIWIDHAQVFTFALDETDSPPVALD